MPTPRTIVIVGANLAGGRAAEALRAKGFDGRVVLIGAEPHPPYERPPLSKELLMGSMGAEAPLLRSEAAWAELGVDLVLGELVTAVEPAAGGVTLADGRFVAADRVLLCTGSRPRLLEGPGCDLPGIVHLRTLDDATAIASRLGDGASVVVVGAGFVGAEVAASAVARGCRVTMLEAEVAPLQRVFGPDLGAFFADLHRSHGVDLRTRTTVERFTGGDRVERVVLSDGDTVEADIVVVGIGVTPATELAEAAGAVVADGVAVDERCRTSIDGLYAAGDVTRHPNRILGTSLRLESWHNAQQQAVAAAGSMIGEPGAYDEVPWFWSDQYDVNLQMAGLPVTSGRACVRGDPGGGSFCVFAVRDGRLVGALGVNRPRDLRRSMALIRSQAPVDPARLSDEDVDLRTLQTTERMQPAGGAHA